MTFRAPLYTRRWEQDPAGISRRSQDGITGFGQWLTAPPAMPVGGQIFALPAAQQWPAFWAARQNSFLAYEYLDQFFGAPGQVLNYDWPNPVRLPSWTAALTAGGMSAPLSLLSGHTAIAANLFVGVEYLAAWRQDNALSTEWVFPARADGPLLSDFLSATHIDLDLPIEALAGWQVNAVALSEVLAAQQQGIGLLAEWAGAVNVTVNDNLPLEWLCGRQIDGSLLFELESSDRIDLGLSIEALTGWQLNAVAPLEWIATQRYDAGLLAAWLLREQIDGLLPLELLSAARVDFDFLTEALGGRRIDVGLPIEWAGAVGVTTNANLPLEWLCGGRVDGSLLFDLISAARVDLGLPIEALAGWQVSAITSLDILVAQWRDLGLMAEWTGAIGVIANANLPLEWISATLIANPLSLEALSFIRLNAGLFVEGLSGQSGSAILLIDALSAGRSDASLLLDWRAAWRSETPLLTEFLVLLRSDQRLPIGGLVSATILAPLPVEWLLSTEVRLTSDAGLPFEWFGSIGFPILNDAGLVFEILALPKGGPGQIILVRTKPQILIVSNDLLPKNG